MKQRRLRLTRAQALAYKRRYAVVNRSTLAERRCLSMRERFTQLMSLMALAHGLRLRQRRVKRPHDGHRNWVRLHEIYSHG